MAPRLEVVSMALDDSEFEYLWTTERDQWALEVIRGRDEKIIGYLIVNTQRGSALIVDDRALADRLHRRMLLAGCRVINT